MTQQPSTGEWWWHLETDSAQPVTDSSYAAQRFPSQAEAEAWLSEIWGELADEGVAAVRLLQGDREVYGPMSLLA